MKNKLKEKIERLKRSYRIFKHLSYSTCGWCLTKNGKGGFILSDRNFELYNANKIKYFFKKIAVAWLLADWYDVKNDGLYRMYPWGKKIEYQKVDYFFKY